MKQELYIRADGNSSIGLGHLTRCISLAGMIKDDFAITFHCLNIPAGFENILHEQGFELHLINDENNFLEKILPGCIVILDGYKFSSEYQMHVKSLGAKLVLIDDLHNEVTYADLLINHTPGLTIADIRKQWYTQLCLGLDYALLRSAFLQLAQKERSIDVIENVLICFGGSDFRNLTESTLNIVETYREFKKIIVITGSAYNNASIITKKSKSDSRIVHYHNLNEFEMVDAFANTQLAIIPSSTILLEAIAAKCLIISGYYVDNQKYLYENLKQIRAFTDANDFNTESLKNALDEVLTERIQKFNLIDGQSVFRIKKCFFSLSNDSKSFLREALISDLDLTFGWAVDPIVRKYSFHTDRISKEEHSFWFRKKLKDPNCFFFILILDEEPIGSIRFDLVKGEAVISYLINPCFHGKGLGQVLLKKGLLEMLRLRNEGKAQFESFIGLVMIDNKGSVKAFEKLGFSEQKQDSFLKFELKI